jgi:hypothetical protein
MMDALYDNADPLDASYDDDAAVKAAGKREKYEQGQITLSPGPWTLLSGVGW